MLVDPAVAWDSPTLSPAEMDLNLLHYDMPGFVLNEQELPHENLVNIFTAADQIDRGKKSINKLKQSRSGNNKGIHD